MSRVAAVAIGRNEGERLVRCLASLAGRAAPVVYVDSGSTDGSLAAAAAAGALVARLDPDAPFTAARARNAGVAALRAAGATPDYIQFVDGDCALDPDWIAAATAFLDGEPRAAVACGRRRERFPEASVYNRLCDMEWDTPVGQARACGGDSLMRRAAFEAVDGFDGRLICGEEPELCLRLRAAGWTIWRLDREMTRHDAAILRFGQWWRRAVRGGWACAEGAALHGAAPERYNRRERRSLWLWGAAAPAAILTAAALGAGLLAAGAPVGWAALGVAGLGLAACAAMALRVARGRRVSRGASWREALLYGVFTMLSKPAQAQGALRFLRARRRGEAARIIEYKAAG